MLTAEMQAILDAARPHGWVLEPEAKRLLRLAGLAVPRGCWARDRAGAVRAAAGIGYPVVAKVVSPQVVHKSEVGGVVTGLADEEALAAVWKRLEPLGGFEGLLVEETLSGVELILGARVDAQFGPVVLLGMGGTGVEIYGDVALRMAPLTDRDVGAMLDGLTARPLLEGYRGAAPIDRDHLTGTVRRFADLVMALAERIESIDVNPLICSAAGCWVADARIMLSASGG